MSQQLPTVRYEWWEKGRREEETRRGETNEEKKQKADIV